MPLRDPLWYDVVLRRINLSVRDWVKMMSDAQQRTHLFDALNQYGLPTGVYVVRKVGDEERIVNCNEQFARIFGYVGVEEVLDSSPLDLHRNMEDYHTFMGELVQNGEIRHYTETLISRLGVPLMVEIHARLDYDEQGEVIGRTGIVMDVSDFELLLKDIGQILHHFTSTMTGFEKRLDALHDHLNVDKDPFGKLSRLPDAIEVDQVMIKPAEELRVALGKLVEEVSGNERKRSAFSDDDWETLLEQREFLEGYRDHIELAESRPTALRFSARLILDILRSIKTGFLSKETTRLVNDRAGEVERLVCVYDLHLTSDRLLELDHEVHMLREVALHNIRSKETPDEITIADMMTTAQQYMHDFAASRDIELKIRDRTKQATVVVNRRDMMRALQNLLHNAIKYSWSKRDGRPWVEIRGSVKQNYAIIEIENYGVPIPRQEIESGYIFNMGTRGRMSGDRSRMGTGIGLYDSRRVAMNHGGNVELRSSPARTASDPDDLDQPFVTIATLRIPVALRGY